MSAPTPGLCQSCHCGTIPPHSWRALREMRPEWKRSGLRQGAGRSLCRPCYLRHMRAGSLDQYALAINVIAQSCLVSTCESLAHGHGYCEKHLRRLRKFGDTELPRVSPESRFWSRVTKTTTCWLWTGALDPSGYGRTRLHGGSAHRASYEMAFGSIPEGYQVDHVWARGCVNRNCVNPAHLEPVLPAENNRRSNSVTALNLRKTECKRGHLFDDENTYWRPDRRGRHCRACDRLRRSSGAA